MAVLDTNRITMARPVTMGATTLSLTAAEANVVAAQIIAAADVTLVDPIGGSFSGAWKFGFIQLEYAETNYARYRGLQDSHGSTLSTSSRLSLARDTDEHHPDLWYDPPSLGVVSGRGTVTLGAATPVPATGLVTHVMMSDQPQQPFPTRFMNPHTRFFNYLHHMESAFMFCTILAAQEPGGRFHLLKHFYWNMAFEAYFTADSAGAVRVQQIRRQAVNIQSVAHSGPADDHRFRGRELDRSLRIANNFTTHERFGWTWNDV